MQRNLEQDIGTSANWFRATTSIIKLTNGDRKEPRRYTNDGSNTAQGGRSTGVLGPSAHALAIAR